MTILYISIQHKTTPHRTETMEGMDVLVYKTQWSLIDKDIQFILYYLDHRNYIH